MKRLIFLFLIIFSLIIFLQAKESSFLGGVFIDNGIAARPLGLGGAYTAIADDANASWWNPAGLAFLSKKKKSMSFTYIPSLFSVDESKISKYFISYGQGDTSGYGGLGGSLSYLNINIGADYAGDKEYSWTEYVALISWGTQIDKYIGWVKYKYPKLALGINIKYMGVNSDLTLDSTSVNANGFGLDVSLLLAIKENLKIGIMGKDIYSQVKWNTGTVELIPYTLRGGLYYGITDNFLISGEVKFLENDQGFPEFNTYNIGTEYIFEFGKKTQIRKAGLRAGLSVDPNNDYYIVSGGASLYMDTFSVDYVYQYYIKTLISDNTQRFGITVYF